MADYKEESREVIEEKFKEELEGTIYTSEFEIKTYVELRKEGMAEVGAIEALNSFGEKELEAITRFRRLYSHYFTKPSESPNDLTVTLSADVSDFLTGVKAAQRELRELTKAVREYEEASEGVTLPNVDSFVYLDGKKVGEVIAPDVIDISTKAYEKVIYDLSEVPTCELHEELATREGVTEYYVGPHGEHAIIKFYDDMGIKYNVDVSGARIIVNKD